MSEALFGHAVLWLTDGGAWAFIIFSNISTFRNETSDLFKIAIGLAFVSGDLKKKFDFVVFKFRKNYTNPNLTDWVAIVY